MASSSSRGATARQSKVTKGKGKPAKSGTAHTKNHRFESFTTRISKLNIDPLRRSANAHAHHTLDGEASHFKASFDEWCDLNMSENFIAFRSEVEPLSQSLPQIVHYEAQIIEVLVRHLEKRDELSLEPLLALTSHLAYDLGSRFEKHFARAVGTVADIAATHPSIEVIEWSFTCLAYLFKFLSRLLVSDLRPLFDLMAPFLGKSLQKHYITRFAAESLSFLVKKAGGLYSRNSKPLNLIIQHAFDDLVSTESSQADQYANGLAVLFSESIKGIKSGTNASGASIAHALMTHMLASQHTDTIESRRIPKAIELILTNLIHETDGIGFEPILNEALQILASEMPYQNIYTTTLAARLVVVLAGVRQGSRITEWSNLLQVIPRLLEAYISQVDDQKTQQLPQVLQATAVVLQYAPLDAILPASRKILGLIKAEQLERFFLSFCFVFEQLGRQRFDSLLLPDFQLFISSKWAQHEEELCFILPKLCSSREHPKENIHIPEQWLDTWPATLDRLHDAATSGLDNLESTKTLGLSNRYLDLLLHDIGSREATIQVSNSICRLMRTLDTSIENAFHQRIACLIFGKGSLILNKLSTLKDKDAPPSDLMVDASQFLCSSPLYLQGLSTGINSIQGSTDQGPISHLTERLVNNLASSSHQIRLLSLEILQHLKVRSDGSMDQGLQLAIVIERTATTFENVREIAKDVRNLASLYDFQPSQSWLRRIIPLYCFGLCHIKLTPIWIEAIETLKIISKSKEVEEIVADQAVRWLQQIPSNDDLSSRLASSDERQFTERTSTDFQCTNLLGLDYLFQRGNEDCLEASQKLHDAFTEDTIMIRHDSFLNRGKALMILSKNPQIVEKKSRMFIPVFLKALAGQIADDIDSPTIDNEHGHLEMQQLNQDSGLIWDLRSRQMILDIFSQFVNPAVVFRTQDVYDFLLEALCNGDSTMQKNSLRAVMAWRPALTKKYRENLLNLLDDARFREELTVFLNTEQDDNLIQAEDKELLMPILLRLLYGRIVARSGTANVRRMQGARRKAVLLSAARLGFQELSDFVQIALGPLHSLRLNTGDDVNMKRLQAILIPARRTLGMMRLVHDILDTVSNYIEPLSEQIMDAIVYCYIHAGESNLSEVMNTDNEVEGNALGKATRHEALDCLVLLFNSSSDRDWASYTKVIMDHIVNPRLVNLPIETAQGISGVLRLFSTWCYNVHTLPMLVVAEPSLLAKVAECLVEKSAREEVKTFILLEIFSKLFTATESLSTAENSHDLTRIKQRLATDVAPNLIQTVSTLISATPGKDCLHACVQALLLLGDAVEKGGQNTGLLQSSTLLLRQPLKVVGPAIKADILRLMLKIIPIYDFGEDGDVLSNLWSTLSIMFSHLPMASERKLLLSTVSEISRRIPELGEAASLCSLMNAYSLYRAGEPDYEKRLEAFNVILSKDRAPFDSKTWQPLLHNMMFLIKDNDELSMRTSSSLGLQRFVEEAVVDDSPGMKAHLADTLIPALQRGMKEHSELIKAEYVAILTKIIGSGYPAMSDMSCLIGPDEESAFFNNVLHIQQHRRLRALRKLGSEVNNLSSTNISRFCMPLIEMFTADNEGSDSNLTAEAVITLGLLSEGLAWPAYRSLVQRLTNNSETYTSKTHIRALGVVVQALVKASAGKDTPSSADDKLGSALSSSLPGKAALTKAVSQMVLPKIQEFVHYKDEAVVDLRVMVSLIAVRLIMLFDDSEIAIRLPTVLIDICNVLRSKAQEARDAARKTLADVASIIGPQYFSFILKQLRSSLERGSRLHVLSYTIHSLLVSVQPVYGLGDLDECVPDIMDIVVSDIFGNVGQEKDSEGYISKMKEVRKKNLSYDTMELLASVTHVEKAGALVSPIRSQLDKVRPRLEKVDELLRRLREGFRRNIDANNQQWLTLCYQILRSALERADPEGQMAKPIAYKMSTFGWDLLRRILDKHESLKTVSNLQGFLPMLRLCLQQHEEEAQTAAMRLLTSIIKTPLEEIDENAGDYIKAIKRTIEDSSSTSTPLAQAALRLLSALLRERPYAIIKQSFFENHIAYILTRVKPDLNEPAHSGERDKQVAAFNFLKAVLSRGVLIKEVYEVMEAVREVMITTTEHPIPDLARSVYSRFVLDYFPEEGKGFSKQLDFMVANLQYPNPNGRQAIMDVIIFLVNKKDINTVQAVLLELFLPLVIVMASDESDACRESARVILRRLLERSSKDTKKTLRAQIRNWLNASADDMWKSIGFQCSELYLDINRDASSDAATALVQAGETIKVNASASKGDAHDALRSALNLLKTVCSTFPATAFSGDYQDTWTITTGLVASKSSAIRLLSANLFSLYLAHFARHAGAKHEATTLPLSTTAGLTFSSEDAVAVIEANTAVLQSAVGADLAATDAIIANLAFIGRVSAGGAESQLALNSLMKNVANAVRFEAPSGSSLRPKLAALRLLQSLVKTVPLEGLQPTMEDTLLALNNLTDNDIPKAASMDPDEVSLQDQLTTTAQESLDTVQGMLGPQEFVRQMQKVQSQVKERREERRAKRRIDAVAQPERAEKIKQRKHESGKNKRREKNKAMAGRRRGW